MSRIKRSSYGRPMINYNTYVNDDPYWQQQQQWNQFEIPTQYSQNYNPYLTPYQRQPPPVSSPYFRPSPYSRPQFYPQPGAVIPQASSSYSRPSPYGRPPQPIPPKVPQFVPVVTTPIPALQTTQYVIVPNVITTTFGPLFGGLEPGSGTLAPIAPTDQQTEVEATERENEVRKARGGPPGFNVDSIIETGTLPPQAAIPSIPMPPIN